MTATSENQATRLAALRRKSGLTRDQVSEKLKQLDPKAARTGTQIMRYEDDATIRLKKPVLVGLSKIYRTTPDFIEQGATAKLPSTESTAEVLGTQQDLPYIELTFIRPAAYGTFGANCQDYKEEDFDTFKVLKRTGHDYTKAVVIEVRGNSMAPRYPDRSCYVVRPVSQGNWQYATGVHCISLRSEMFVIKRITTNKDGIMTLTSDNGGDEITIQLGDILCMWKVGEAAYLPAED